MSMRPLPHCKQMNFMAAIPPALLLLPLPPLLLGRLRARRREECLAGVPVPGAVYLNRTVPALVGAQQ